MSIPRNSIPRVMMLTLAAVSLLGASLWLYRQFETMPWQVSTPGASDGATKDLAPPLAIDSQTKARISETYGKLPLRFEINAGQADSQVRFISRGLGYNLFLKPTEALIRLGSINRTGEEKSPASAARTTSSDIRMRFVNANPSPKIEGVDAIPGKSNYFIGNDPSKWRQDVTGYAKARYEGVYPGIDLVYYGNQQQLEYDFIVAPGADPGAVKLGFDGMEGIEIDAQGDLVLHSAAGDVRQHKPIAYQEVDGQRREVESRFVLRGKNEIGFELADFDHSRSVVIDPVLVYSTILGGSYQADIAIDRAGNAYVTGTTDSLYFPTVNPLDPNRNNGDGLNFYTDAYITKFKMDGSGLVFSTYLGGNGGENGSAIAVDRDGAVYVAGETTSGNFPVSSPLQPALAGSYDAFLVKLNPAGSALIYSTYFGGSGSDGVSAMKVNAEGNVYLAGTTNSTNIPLKSPLQAALAGGSADIFITKLNASATALVYSTYLGGNQDDSASGMGIDNAGCAYVTGRTNSTNFPTVTPAQPAVGGLSDAFVSKLAEDGTALLYSTYLGGDGYDSANGIAVDISGNAYLTGYTTSTNFPTRNPLQPGLAGTSDAFVTKLNRTGSALSFSSYLGGDSTDNGNGIAVDAEGAVYLTGGTASKDFPNIDGVQPMPDNISETFSISDFQAFITKLDPRCSQIEYSSYLGGRDNDLGLKIRIDGQGSVYVLGNTSSSDFPTSPGAFRRDLKSRSGFNESPSAFLVKINDRRRLSEAE